MKKIILILILQLLVLSGIAQTNVIYGNVANYISAPQKRVAVTVTLLAPNPRYSGNSIIRQDAISVMTDTNGNFSLTNLLFGYYRLDVAGAIGTPNTFWVQENTIGVVPIVSLISNSKVQPPNPATNYYTMPQVDALIAGVQGGSGSGTGGFTNAGGVTAGWLTNQTFSTTGSNDIRHIIGSIIATNEPAYALTAGQAAQADYASSANTAASASSSPNGRNLDSVLTNLTATFGGSATGSVSVVNGNVTLNIGASNSVASGSSGFSTNALTATNAPDGNRLLSGLQTTNAFNSLIAASGAVTNDAAVASFIAARPTLSARAKDLLAGSVAEITAAGYRSRLLDMWPLYTMAGPLFGTNQTSLNSNLWTGWNQAVTGAYPNLNNGTVTASNQLTIAPINGAFTIGIVVKTPQLWNSTGSAISEYRFPYFVLKNTNNLSFFSLVANAPSQDVIAIISGTNYAYSVGNNYTANSLAPQTTAGFTQKPAQTTNRRTYVLSFNGTNRVCVWVNGEPCAVNGGSVNTAFLSFTNSFSLTNNTVNSLFLGYEPYFATNYDSANKNGFAGNIMSLALFSGACEENTFTANGTVIVPPMVNAITKSLRWLEPSDTEVIFTGTSMFSPDFGIGNTATNIPSQTYALLHPQWPIQDYSRAGSELSCMTNMGSTSTKVSVAKLSDVPVYRFSFNHFNCLPWWVKCVEITDHGRNDASKLTTAQIHDQIDSFYGPLKTNGATVVWVSDSIPTTNGGSSTLAAQQATIQLAFSMKTNRSISRYVGNHKYVSPGGIIDANNLALSTGAHWDGSNQGLADWMVRQQCLSYDGIPFYYPLPGTTSVSNYPVTLSGNPASWTNNLVATDTIFTYSGGTVTGIGVNGASYPLSTSGGTITLQPFEWISFTNSGVPTAVYKPVP